MQCALKVIYQLFVQSKTTRFITEAPSGIGVSVSIASERSIALGAPVAWITSGFNRMNSMKKDLLSDLDAMASMREGIRSLLFLEISCESISC